VASDTGTAATVAFFALVVVAAGLLAGGRLGPLRYLLACVAFLVAA
jgi:hypothetical protein